MQANTIQLDEVIHWVPGLGSNLWSLAEEALTMTTTGEEIEVETPEESAADPERIPGGGTYLSWVARSLGVDEDTAQATVRSQFSMPNLLYSNFLSLAYTHCSFFSWTGITS